jgi:hypothetical protein
MMTAIILHPPVQTKLRQCGHEALPIEDFVRSLQMVDSNGVVRPLELSGAQRAFLEQFASKPGAP